MARNYATVSDLQICFFGVITVTIIYLAISLLSLLPASSADLLLISFACHTNKAADEQSSSSA